MVAFQILEANFSGFLVPNSVLQRMLWPLARVGSPSGPVSRLSRQSVASASR